MKIKPKDARISIAAKAVADFCSVYPFAFASLEIQPPFSQYVTNRDTCQYLIMRLCIIILQEETRRMSMRIKDLREDSDLTQKQIAGLLHVKQNTYSQYENGHRQLPIECLLTLAKFYKTSTDYILGLTDNPSPK